MVRILLSAFALLSVACYNPEFRDCAVTCAAGGGCPANSTCGPDGFCYAGSSLEGVVLCGERPDASVSDAPTGVDAAAPDEDGSPVDPDAGSPTCSPCELVSQCGCSSTEACDRDGSGGTICRPAGSGVDGEPCDSATSCAEGYFCASNGITLTCQRYCDDDTVCQGGGGLCNLTVGDTDQGICTVDCDPVTATGCAPGHGCSVGRNPITDRDHTLCFKAGSGTDSDSCTRHEDCAAGFHCADLSPKRCLRYCTSIGSGIGCPGGTTCTSIGGGSFIGGTEFGLCI